MLASHPEVRMKTGLDEAQLSSGIWFLRMPKPLLLFGNFKNLHFTLPQVRTIKKEGLSLINKPAGLLAN